MYLKCEQHGVFYSNKSQWKCKYCGKNLKFICDGCESWYYCTYKNIHETTEKHQTNKKNIANKPEEMILFTFFGGKTYRVLITTSSSVETLKKLSLKEVSPNLKDESYFVTTLKDNTYCNGNDEALRFFENFDFFVLNEKTLLEDIGDKLIFKLQQLMVSDKSGEKQPLLDKI